MKNSIKTDRIKSFLFDDDVELWSSFEGEDCCSFVIRNFLQRFVGIIRSDKDRHSAHPVSRYSVGNNNCQLNFNIIKKLFHVQSLKMNLLLMYNCNVIAWGEGKSNQIQFNHTLTNYLNYLLDQLSISSRNICG